MHLYDHLDLQIRVRRTGPLVISKSAGHWATPPSVAKADPGAWSNALDDALNSSLGGAHHPRPTPVASIRVDHVLVAAVEKWEAKRQNEASTVPVGSCRTHSPHPGKPVKVLRKMTKEPCERRVD